MVYRAAFPARSLFTLLLLSAVLAVPARAAVLFDETFADNHRGWTFDTDWQIGPAVGLQGYLIDWYDPPTDRSPGSDNGLLGTVIGGPPTNVVHDWWYATSPVIDLSGAAGGKQLSFWRKCTTFYDNPDVDVIVEGWNGSYWVPIWDVQGTYYYLLDQEWTYATFDVSAFTNADFRVRFGFKVNNISPYGSSLGIGGWSVDDVRVYTTGDCADADADGYWSAACGGGDEDDSNPAVHPGAGEVCDGLDNDCDGEVDEGVQTAFYTDVDGDGYGAWTDSPLMACSAPPGYVANSYDCDDTRATVYPGAPELCDSLDNNCNGWADEYVAPFWYLDEDGDGYGGAYTGVQACTQPEGRIAQGGDCDDANPNVHPGVPELDNWVDDDCDGVVDEGFEVQRIRWVRDVPGDQGRAVRVRWRRNIREVIPIDYPTALFANYILYRRVEPGQSLAARAKPEGPLAVNLPPGEWDVAATVLGTLDTTYQVVVPTLCDSNAAGTCRATFFVRARWEDQQGYYVEDSAPDSGYSVDNIPPAMPPSFSATVKPTGNQLTWSTTVPPDFQAFRVYRSTDPDFTPGPATLVHTTGALNWTDPVHTACTYKLTAMDVNGNESPPAVATASLSVPGRPLATELAFAALAPNPFRGALAVTFDVPRDGTAVELSVHDLAGRRVRTLADRTFEAGRHSLSWDGHGDDGRVLYPGVYLVRVVGDGRSQARRVTLLP